MADPSVFKGKHITSMGFGKGMLSQFAKVTNDNKLLQGNIKVYEDTLIPKDKVIVGYRGKEFFDAGFFYTPKMPDMEYYTVVLRDAGIFPIGDL